MEESCKGLGLASRNETLDGEVSVEDANARKVMDSGVCDVSDEKLNDGGSVCDKKQVRVDVGSVEKTDAFAGAETERSQMECDGDAGAVEVNLVNGESHQIARDEETVNSVGVEVTDEKANCQVEDSCGGESHQIAGDEETVISAGGNEVNDEKANCQVEDSCGGDGATTSDVEQVVQTEKSQQSSVDGEMCSVAEEKADQEKESAHESDEDNNKMDVDSKQANEEVPEEPTELSKGEVKEGSGADTCCEEETSNVNQKEENGEAKEMDYTSEEQMEENVLDSAGNESAGASIVTSQDVPIAEADGNGSNVVKDMKVDELKESAATGNIQDLKTETDISLKEDKKAISLAEEVPTVDCKETESVDATVNAEFHDNLSLSAEENHEEKDKEAADQQDAMREEDDTAHEAPSMEPNQNEDTEMEENPNNSHYAKCGTDSDAKTNGVKRKADVLSEDSLGEGRKTVSLAKVSFGQRPSFKIGACIARAASQMAGSPSALKNSNSGDETLSVESFVSQLHCAATEPDKENTVSEIASEFLVDFRNSSASQDFTPEKVGSKRGRPSSSNAGGTKTFEFEEMGDTYWTDRVIHNGGEEQTPPTEKENNQVVPVELKPAPVKRTRRPYRRRQSQISIPLPSASDRPANFDENAPAELIMNFAETDTIPPEKSLSKMFRHFGPIMESQTEVDKENHRARVVYKKGADAEVAYNSVGRFNIFGAKVVNYELSFTITETFKVQPYVVSLGEEDAAHCLPS